MNTATRLPTDMNGWCPDSRHYQVEGGYLVVTMANYMTAEGTDVFYADERGGAQSMTPILSFPHGTDHEEALSKMGYTVEDTFEPEPEPVDDPLPEPTLDDVLSLLPPGIAAAVASAGAVDDHNNSGDE